MLRNSMFFLENPVYSFSGYHLRLTAFGVRDSGEAGIGARVERDINGNDN